MNFHVNGGGLWVLFFPLVYIALVIYFVLRFLHAMERGVAAHERIADELGRLQAGGIRDGTGVRGT